MAMIAASDTVIVFHSRDTQRARKNVIDDGMNQRMSSVILKIGSSKYAS
jgi:hypothetical protein